MRQPHRISALLAALTALASLPPAAAQDAPYEGHMVVRAHMTTQEQVDRMLAISPDPWSHHIGVGWAEFRIPPDAADALDASGVPYQVVIPDLQQVVDAEREAIALRAGGFFDAYQPPDEIDAFLDALVALRPDLIERMTIGTSIEGRPIDAFRIGAAGADKPALLAQATQHAREWIAPMAAVFLADRLVNGYDADAEVRRLLDSMDFYIVPVVNPDGYAYSWSTERFWRKNRRDIVGSSFFGVDLNRNWASGWGGTGSSGDPWSQVYRGTAPFSEPETQTMRDFVLAHPEIGAMLDIHTFGQLVLSPPGQDASLAPPPDDETFQNLSDDLAEAIFQVHQVDYLAGPAGALQFVAAGDAPDWHYFERDMLAWTFELRPASSADGGFAPPPDQILPNSEEILPAALLAADMTLRSADIRLAGALPEEAPPETPVEVTARILPLVAFDAIDSASVALHARILPAGAWQPVPMLEQSPGDFAASLPPAPAGATVEFYIEAAATGGAATTLPTLGPEAPFTLPIDQPADLTDDGVVDGADLGVLLGAWGQTASPADLNGDGVVDGADLGALLGAWGP